MGIEIQILDFLQTIRTSALDEIMCFITRLGNAGKIWILLALILLINKKTRKTGVIMAVAFVTEALLCNGILKNLVARTRPYDLNTAIEIIISKPKDYSFPSGHTGISFAAVAALYFAGEKNLWKIALVLASLIAFSRMYLYVHFPTDILGGILVAILSGYIAKQIVDKFSKKCKVCGED